MDFNELSSAGNYHTFLLDIYSIYTINKQKFLSIESCKNKFTCIIEI